MMAKGTWNIPIEVAAAMPLRCAWRGCTAACEPLPAPLPAGWFSLVTFRETARPGVLDFVRDRTRRDAVLCAEHHAALERLLEPI
jgi:hypothetical protein